MCIRDRPLAESAARSGVCAVAHTKSAGILRLRSGGLLSGAHRRASVEARSRRTPALDLPAEAPSTARGLHGRHKLKTAAALRSGCFRSWMKGLFSEQRARMAATRPCAGAREASLLWPGGLDRSRLAARALTDRGRDPTPGCSACACPSPVARLLRNQAAPLDAVANTLKVGPHTLAAGRSLKGPTFRVFARSALPFAPRRRAAAVSDSPFPDSGP